MLPKRRIHLLFCCPVSQHGSAPSRNGWTLARYLKTPCLKYHQLKARTWIWDAEVWVHLTSLCIWCIDVFQRGCSRRRCGNGSCARCLVYRIVSDDSLGGENQFDYNSVAVLTFRLAAVQPTGTAGSVSHLWIRINVVSTMRWVLSFSYTKKRNVYWRKF